MEEIWRPSFDQKSGSNFGRPDVELEVLLSLPQSVVSDEAVGISLQLLQLLDDVDPAELDEASSGAAGSLGALRPWCGLLPFRDRSCTSTTCE